MFSTNSCVKCKYNITDPVCGACYIKQTRALLNDLKLNYVTNEFVLAKVKKIFPGENLNETICILCQKEDVVLCRYCFLTALIKILRELNFPEELIEIFDNHLSSEDVLFEGENREHLEITSF